MFREHLAGGFTHHQGAVFICRARAEPPAEGAAKGPWGGSLVLAGGRVSSGLRTGPSQKAGRQSFSLIRRGGGMVHHPRFTSSVPCSSARGWLAVNADWRFRGIRTGVQL